MLSRSVMPDFCMPWTVGPQAPLSMEFSRQEYWSVLLFPSPGDLPSPGIKPASPALAGKFFTTAPPGKPLDNIYYIQYEMYDTETKLVVVKRERSGRRDKLEVWDYV